MVGHTFLMTAATSLRGSLCSARWLARRYRTQLACLWDCRQPVRLHIRRHRQPDRQAHRPSDDLRKPGNGGKSVSFRMSPPFWAYQSWDRAGAKNGPPNSPAKGARARGLGRRRVGSLIS